LLTVLAYLPALRGGFIWDDDDYVSNNQTLRSMEGLRSIWLEPAATPQYYPLVHTSYWAEYRLWGLDPTGYHITNLLLHIAAAFILWRVLLLLSVPGAWLIAGIFAVHPVHVESVAWITERKNVLSGVLYLSSMLAYLHFALDAPERPGRRRVRLYAAACALFVLALLSKTVTASLPAALLLLIVWKRGRVLFRDVWQLVPLFVAGGAMAGVTAWIEKHHVGAQGADWQFSPLDRLAIAGRALWFYAGKLIWPVNLTFIYPRWQVGGAHPAQLAYPLAAAAAIAALWLARRRIGSAPLVAVLFFAGTLVPALGFFDVFPMRYSFVADHFQYLASIGLIALAVAVGVRLRERWAPSYARASHALAAILLLVLATLTWRQAHIYADQETLWSDTLKKDPESWMAHTCLGALLGRRGETADAEYHYREAVRLNPNFATARFDFGALLANQGRFKEAIPQMREDVRLEPGSQVANLNLGKALLYDGQIEEAVSRLRADDGRWPQDPQTETLLQQALMAQKRVQSRALPGSSENPGVLRRSP
jgi:Tfp pilus assembly protein PilF